MSDKKYYISSFFWSTLSKILAAVVGFITVPLLLGAYGKADYGIIAIATSCNGYMYLLDLGMNTGAVRFFSRWKAEGKRDLVNSVARTNISFYLIISVINILGLIALAICGEPLFAVTHEQFLTLRSCLYIIALFATFSWVTTAFNQLLIADKQMAFTMKCQSALTLLKGLLIGVVLVCQVSIETYFFLLTMLVALLILPYAIKCKRDGLIDSIRPGNDWRNFRQILTFSLSLFALSIFQTTATQSRPILLSMFAANGAETVTEFRIIEVVPSLVIMIGGVFTSIFLPKTSGMAAKGNQQEIEQFAYKWTQFTSIIACMLCFPFMLCAKEVLTAYVGAEYAGLSFWMILWCVTVLVQIHTTPGNSLVLAYGKTRILVITSAVSCVISMIINITLCKTMGVGSAVIGYFVYVIIVIGLYYLSYYKKLIRLKRRNMAIAFLRPTALAVLALGIVEFIPRQCTDIFVWNERFSMILQCLVKTSLWIIPYALLLFGTGTLTKSILVRK